MTTQDLPRRSGADNDAGISAGERAAPENLSDLLANLNGMAYRCANELDWPLIYASAGALALTGYRPDQLLAQQPSFGELMHVDDVDRVWAEVQEALATKERFQISYRITTASGQVKWVWEQGCGIFDADGSVRYVEGFITDTTERELAKGEIKRLNRTLAKAVQELQHQRSELRAVFDLAPALVWVTDVQGNLVQINQRAVNHLGISVDEAVGRHITEVFPDLGPENAKEDREILQTGKSLLGKVHRSVAPDGTECWFHSDKVPFSDGNDKIIGIMVMRHDITERKKVQDSLRELNVGLENRVRERTAELALARDEAEQANEAKSVFLATMSHEIRTPMGGLLGLLELLDLTALDAEQHATLAIARESGRALQQIIDGILDFAKIEAHSLELNVTPGSLMDVVTGVCQLHKPIARAKNLSLGSFVAPGIRPLLLFDGLRVGQILNNLVGNAIKFTEHGSVTLEVDLVRSTADREHLRLTVTDTGIGIPAERIEHLFQPFVQADARISTRFGGTGLGLFIARSLASLMGGTLSLESTPGQGTRSTFSVAFEACPETSKTELQAGDAHARLGALVARRPQAPSIADAVVQRSLLLIVDDHPVNAMVLLRQAATLGYAAEMATDGAQALQAWESGRFAAVLTDCNMPGMSGYELAASIRAREAAVGSPRAPIIGCTANALASALQDCLDAGMDDLITKPATLEDICDKLDRWIPLPQAAGRSEVATATRPPRPAAASAEGLLDRALLTEIAGGDPQTFAQVIADLRRSNESDSQGLRAAVATSDFRRAVELAHRMRGACAMLGALQLADASARVQGAAGDRDMQRLQAAMGTFERELLRLNKYIDALT